MHDFNNDEEARLFIYDHLHNVLSVMEDYGLITVYWDENGRDSYEPTQLFNDLEEQGNLLTRFIINIMNEEEIEPLDWESLFLDIQYPDEDCEHEDWET